MILNVHSFSSTRRNWSIGFCVGYKHSLCTELCKNAWLINGQLYFWYKFSFPQGSTHFIVDHFLDFFLCTCTLLCVHLWTHSIIWKWQIYEMKLTDHFNVSQSSSALRMDDVLYPVALVQTIRSMSAAWKKTDVSHMIIKTFWWLRAFFGAFIWVSNLYGLMPLFQWQLQKCDGKLATAERKCPLK